MSSWYRPTPAELLELITRAGASVAVRVKSGKTQRVVEFRFRCRGDGKRIFLDVKREPNFIYIGSADATDRAFRVSDVAVSASAFDREAGRWLADGVLAGRDVGAETVALPHQTAPS